MAIATFSGAWVLPKNYRIAEGALRARSERNAATGGDDHPQADPFPHQPLGLLAKNPSVSDLAEFGAVANAVAWTSMLPGTLGTALVRHDGTVIGNPISRRVELWCEADLKHFASVEKCTSSYPVCPTRRRRIAVVLRNIEPQSATARLAQTLASVDGETQTASLETYRELRCALNAGITPISKSIFSSPEDVLRAADQAM